MIYRFPATKFSQINTIEEQLSHVQSEASEILVAHLCEESPARLAEETVDLIHSCETLLRKLQHEHKVDPNLVAEYVVKKNRSRHYYAEEVPA